MTDRHQVVNDIASLSAAAESASHTFDMLISVATAMRETARAARAAGDAKDIKAPSPYTNYAHFASLADIVTALCNVEIETLEFVIEQAKTHAAIDH